jgi:hypothetical protein
LQALLRLLGSEPPMAASQILKHFLNWDVLLKNNCNNTFLQAASNLIAMMNIKIEDKI